MTSRGSRRLLLSGSELKERGRREAPFFYYIESLRCLVEICTLLRSCATDESIANWPGLQLNSASEFSRLAKL